MVTCLEMGSYYVVQMGFDFLSPKRFSWKLRLYAHGHTSSLLTIFSGCIVVQESIAEGSEGNCPTLSTLLSSRVLPGFLLRD